MPSADSDSTGQTAPSPLTPVSEVDTRVYSPLTRSFTYTSGVVSVSPGWRFDADEENPTRVPSADRNGTWLSPSASTPVSEVDTKVSSPLTESFT